MSMLRKRKGKSQSGFTLVEVMVVIAMISILAAIGIPKLANYLLRAEVSEADQQFGRILAALAEYTNSRQVDSADVITNVGSYNCLSSTTGGTCAAANYLSLMIPTVALPDGAAFEYVIKPTTSADTSNSGEIVYCIVANEAGTTNKTVAFSSALTKNPRWENHISAVGYYTAGAAHVAGGYCGAGNNPDVSTTCTDC